MRILPIALTAAALACSLSVFSAESSTNASPAIAQALGKTITASDIGLAVDANNHLIISAPKDASCLVKDPVQKLCDLIRSRVAVDYIENNGLKATEDEIREMRDFTARSMAEQKIKNEKRLAELEKQLKNPDLTEKEHNRIKDEQAILTRFNDSLPNSEPSAAMNAEMSRLVWAPWIESWKFNKSVYEKYGGTVAVTKFGPNPVAAINSLLKEYERAGKFSIASEELRGKFWAKLEQPPRLVAKPEQIDFTPMWKRTAQQK